MPLANYLSTEMQPQQNVLLLEMESNGIHLTKINTHAHTHWIHWKQAMTTHH